MLNPSEPSELCVYAMHNVFQTTSQPVYDFCVYVQNHNVLPRSEPTNVQKHQCFSVLRRRFVEVYQMVHVTTQIKTCKFRQFILLESTHMLLECFMKISQKIKRRMLYESMQEELPDFEIPQSKYSQIRLNNKILQCLLQFGYLTDCMRIL